MKRLVFILASLSLLPISSHGQVVATPPANDDLTIQKFLLLDDLQSLELRSKKLSAPLARALAKAEIADAAWAFSQEWAEQLLREAYKLTLPEDDQQTALSSQRPGSQPGPLTSEQSARHEVQVRILRIAGRDPQLAHELNQLGDQRLGALESHITYTSLALQTFQDGDKEGASALFMKAIEADPTALTAPFTLPGIAERDPKLADSLMLQYLDRLRSYPLSTTGQGTPRVFLGASNMIFHLLSSNSTAPRPGAAVMRAYASFMLDSLSQLGQSDPGYLLRARGVLLMIWPVVQQYAPDLTGAFMILEQRSRGSNPPPSLPTWESLSAREKNEYESRIKDALESDQPNAMVINGATNRGDFAGARKLIDKLSDGAQKSQLTEFLTSREALDFLKKDNVAEAGRLAERLKLASSIVAVYPALIGKCAGQKEQCCAVCFMMQAMKQLKSSETARPAPPAGMPASFFVTSREIDPILEGMAKLTLAIEPVDRKLALDGLDETVVTANTSPVDTSLGRVGFDVGIFRKLARNDEARVRQAAESFKDPLRQIVALAAVCQWKAEEIKKVRAVKDVKKPQVKKVQ